MGRIMIGSMPYPDELLYSWIIRTAKDNKMAIGLFCEAFLGKEVGRIDSLGVDVRNEYVEFMNSLFVKLNIKETYLKTTTFNFESMFMTSGEQMRYLNNVFYKRDVLNPPSNKLFKTVRVCPECMMEDAAEYGEPYLHRSHQLSGVYTCYKHRKRLKEFVGASGHACDYSESDYQWVVDDRPLEDLNAYTDYVQFLFEHAKNTDMKKVKTIIFDKIRQNGFAINDGYELIKSVFENRKHKSLFTKDIRKYLKVNLIAAENIACRDLIPLLMFLFPNPKDFIDKITNGPDLISATTCKKCGHTYVASTLAIQYGWGCPKCITQQNPADRYKQMVQKMGDCEYEVKAFERMDKTEVIIHKPCGATLLIKPRDFLFSNSRCQCERLISEEEVRQEIEKYAGFKLVNFNGAYRPITIFHETCGRTFTCHYRKFLTSPTCRKCRPKIANAEMFEEQVRDLTGDEYSIVKGFVNKNTNVVLRHNICGEEQEYRVTSFLDGSRCKKCTSPIESDELSKTLSKISHGRYKLVYTGKKKHQAIDTETNKMFPMPLKKVYQEIVRPTPSPYFPMIDKSLPVEVGSAWENGFRILCDYKEEYGHLNIGDIENYKNFRLGKWCREQRTTKRDGRLKANKEEKLLSVGFDFNPKQTAWNVQCERYGRYVKENGKGYASRYVVYEDVRIGTWLQLQRRLFKEQKLPAEKIEKLERINPLIFTDMWTSS